MKPGFVVVDDILIRYTHIIVHYGGIVWNVQEDERLSSRNVPILDALADHVREDLGDDSRSERPRRKHKALTVLIDHVTFRLDLGCQARGYLILR